ncbi:hypothetical protein [Streptomyces sp. NPDC005573]|uniref:hypothetical protein n=1 Tax=Streptomyces sp. NPDC005573 TaxID=3156890 RepID=UPI0033A5D305
MTDPGGGGTAPVRRSRLAEYADMAGPARDDDAPPAPAPSAPLMSPAAQPAAAPAHADAGAEPEAGTDSRAAAEARRRWFTEALADFRDTAVLVPVVDDGWLTTDFGGVRWILAFSDERALARYALARDAGEEEWTYQTVLGARLLDVAVPEAKVPCGVALDAADGAEHALLLPPVAGIVPDAFAVNQGYMGDVAMAARTEGQR